MKYFLFFLFAAAASGQSITPITSECAKKCQSSFSVRNDGLRPLRVTLEPHGFTVAKDGKATLTPLPAGVDLELGGASAVVGVGQSHTFFFRMKCLTTPACHAEIMALTMNGDRTTQGLKLALALPHVVYVCEKRKDCRANTLRTEYGYDPPAKK